jgi:hypothetical protein
MSDTQAQAKHAREFREAFEEFARHNQNAAEHSSSAHADHQVELSFARGRASQHWFTVTTSWAVLLALLGTELEEDDKDGVIFCAGPLKDGKTETGTRKIKEHVHGLDLVVLDFDKGDAPLDKLEMRLKELGLEGAAYATYSHLKAETKLAWSVTRPNPKTGTDETLPTAFQNFARTRIGGDAGADPLQITPEIVTAFMVEEKEFDVETLGPISIVQIDNVERTRFKAKNDNWYTQETRNVVTAHKPLAKSRLVLPLANRFARQPGESKDDFQKRWQEEAYYPVARLIGFRFDSTCASIERGHYVMARRAGQASVPLCHTRGRLIDLHDAEMDKLLAPFKHNTKEKQRAKPAKDERPAGGADDWRGFKAADAAADLLPISTDKRADLENPLVAFPCPFVHEHTTSNDPTAHQCYAYNAASADRVPTVKCHADTCRERPYGEFLEALFDDGVKADPAYRITEKFGSSGVYIPESELNDKLREINEAWAVVRLGNRTRYLHETADGDLEIYDAKSLADWFGNWIYYYFDDFGRRREALIIKAWQKWKHRRQYRGLRFCPEPEGAPAGVYNSYYGFTVEPKRGSWKRLLGHIYRNVCQRDAQHFRFFVAWLAQLVQEPHIKPGTNIVLRGKEGVGKSIVGKWIVKLFGRNAIVVSESGRITGRFNGHLENKLFLMAEEAFWAGDKAAEGKLKDLATGTLTSYERKGLDAYEGKNYTRIMIASNEDWVVPASSGGRRWFVVEVGDEHQKDYAYFAALDEEMGNGGLAAMLHDLLHSKLPEQVNVRDAPVTPWLVEQRLHSYDNKRRWWRGVLSEGGFHDNASETFVPLNNDAPTVVRRNDVFASARPYFLGPKGVNPAPNDVGQFMKKMLGKLPCPRLTIEGKRHRCYVFPSLREMRQKWAETTGETVEAGGATEEGSASEVGQKTPWAGPMTTAEETGFNAIAIAARQGVTDEQELGAAGELAVAESRRDVLRQMKASFARSSH